MTLLRQSIRLVAAVMVIAAVMVSGVGVLLAQEGSRQIVPGTPVTGTLDGQAFAQMYWFDGVAGQVVSLLVSTSAEGLDLALLLADAEGSTLAQDSDAETVGSAEIADVVLPESGRYYVTVLRLTGAAGEGEGEFSLSLVAEGGEATATQPATAEPALVTLSTGMRVSLTWDSTADLDLEVRDPYGNSIYWDNPTVENAVFGQNVNAGCVAPVGDGPTERIDWAPGAVPTGSYEIIVYYIEGCEDNAPANITLSVVVDGAALDTVTGTLLPGQEFLSSFVLTASGQAEQGLSGIDPGTVLSNVSTLLSGQTPISAGESASGVIDADNVYGTYSFTGKTGDIVTVRMDATSGNLDPFLFLLDPNGNTIAYNDDALSAVTKGAEIANHTLVSDGVYTIVATRYGREYGGTEGAYTLTLSGSEFEIPPALAGLYLPAGSVEVSLLWNTQADLQLLVRDPSGTAIYDDLPRSASGGVLAEDGNVNCTNPTTSPVSYIYWPPDRLPPGTYEVEVWYQNTCNDTSPVTFNLTVRVNDRVIIAANEQPVPGQVYLTTFTVDVNGFASAGAGGFIGDSSMLDVGSALGSAIPISYGDTVSGTINQTNKFVLYTFEGEAGDQVRIGMDATAGTLDPTLFLLSPEGTQMASNDDAVLNETMNSLIDNFTLPADGTYIIVATHYGVLYGGTSGTYNLSVVRLN